MSPAAGPDALARAVAEWMIETLSATSGCCSVCLSGGSTPKRLYTLLATPDFAARMPWDRVYWFWGDERFVPPDDPASNYRMVREAMLEPMRIPDSHAHPIPVAGFSPEAAAIAYEELLREFHGSGDLGKPLFDIVLLGLGTNGHTASLFPDTPSLTERTAWATPVTPAGEKTRITLTYPALESCRHAAFIVSGADKRTVLAEVQAGGSEYPAAHFHPAGQLHWFVDAAAAGA